MSTTSEEIERAVAALTALMHREPRLEAELEASRAEFFAGTLPASVARERELAARRHVEWFLFERYSPGLGGVPIESLVHRLGGELAQAGLAEELLASLLGSFCSVFEVTGVQEGEGVWVRDLAAFGQYPLAEVLGSRALEVGDLFVGRIYALGEGLHRMSPAAGFFRNPALNPAIERDLERAREGRRGVLRLSQSELETMFWGSPVAATAPALDPVAEARAVLASGGLERAEIDGIFQALAATPYEDDRLLHGAGDPLGAILDQLAFETPVDLEVARRALLLAWPLLFAAKQAASPVGDLEEGAGGEGSQARAGAREAIEAFDRGRREGRDLDLLFRELERDLGLEPDEEEVTPAPDFPGVVGAMVEEYLWETGREGAAGAAKERALLERFAEFGEEHVGVFENLGARDLLLFASVWLPEKGRSPGPAQTRAILAALRSFCDWSERVQDVPLRAAFEESVAPLEESLPRIMAANLRRASGEPGAGELFEFLGAGAPGDERVRDLRGREHAVSMDASLAERLRPGDRLRAERRGDGELVVFCCYPAQAGSLGRAGRGE